MEHVDSNLEKGSAGGGEYGEMSARLRGRSSRRASPENPRLRFGSKAAATLAVVLLCGGAFAWLNAHAGTRDSQYSSQEELLEAIGASTADLGQSGAGPADVAGLQDESGEAGEITVYVSGRVLAPGVYQLDQTARVIEVIEMAGGAKEDAHLDALNLARVLTDGEQVHVPTVGDPAVPTELPASAQAGPACIDPNTADVSQLQELSGIGPALADRIVTHRETTGSFNSNEDLRNVSGIGPKIYERIQPDLCGG